MPATRCEGSQLRPSGGWLAVVDTARLLGTARPGRPGGAGAEHVDRAALEAFAAHQHSGGSVGWSGRWAGRASPTRSGTRREGAAGPVQGWSAFQHAPDDLAALGGMVHPPGNRQLLDYRQAAATFGLGVARVGSQPQQPWRLVTHGQVQPLPP
jgi:hypothetical protein